MTTPKKRQPVTSGHTNLYIRKETVEPLRRLMDHYSKGYGPIINQLIVDHDIRLGLLPQEGEPKHV